jgi:hypothetical protein
METRDPSDIDRNLSEPVLARRNTLDMSQPEPAERLTIPYFHESAPRLAMSRRSLAEQRSESVGPDTVEELELLRAFRRSPAPAGRLSVLQNALPPPRSAARAATRRRLAQISPGQG